MLGGGVVTGPSPPSPHAASPRRRVQAAAALRRRRGMGGAFRGVGRITLTVLSSHPGPPSNPGNVDNLPSESQATQLLRIPLPFLRDLDPQVQVHLPAQQGVDLAACPGADLLQA